MDIPQEFTSDDRPTRAKLAFAGAEAAQPAPEAAIGGPVVTAETSMEVSRIDSAYAGTPPWDIPGPQPAFVGLAEVDWITGKTLDVGCGTGENALFLAQRGLEVLGVDASVRAIEKARAKAEQRAVRIRFLVADALDLAALGESFDTVIDSGLLHSFSDEDRSRLVSEIHTVLRPGGYYLLLCFSEHATLPGPRRLTQDDIHGSKHARERRMMAHDRPAPSRGDACRQTSRRSACAGVRSEPAR
jgi:SAM-dependent methyltransferase